MAILNDESFNAYGDAYDDYKLRANCIDIPSWVLDLYGSPIDYISLVGKRGVVEEDNHGLNLAEIGWVWCEFFGYDPHNDESQDDPDDGALNR